MKDAYQIPQKFQNKPKNPNPKNHLKKKAKN